MDLSTAGEEKKDDKDIAEKPKDNEDGDQGQTCDPNTHQCQPGKQDGKEGKKENEDPPAKDTPSENKAEQAQEIVAEIPRPESKPTSNAPPKEAKPAEHVDVGNKS